MHCHSVRCFLRSAHSPQHKRRRKFTESVSFLRWSRRDTSMPFEMDCTISATRKVKILLLNTGLPKEFRALYQSLRRTRAPQSGRDRCRLRWSCYGGKERNTYDPRCYRTNRRSCRQRARRQPRATRWQCDGLDGAQHGVNRQTIGTTQRDLAKSIAHSRAHNPLQYRN